MFFTKVKSFFKKLFKKSKKQINNTTSAFYRLDKLYAEDIMIQRSDIVALDITCTKQDIMNAISSGYHSRIPVYDKDIDKIKGFVHIKDLFVSFGSNFEIENIIRRVIFVPPAMKVAAVLARMKTHRVHAAIVVDEFGSTIGMLTMKDIVEEILGDIDDEHDDEIEPSFIKISCDKFEVSAKMEIRDFVQRTGIKINASDQYRTIGGYILSLTGKMPAQSETIISPEGIKFFVLSVDEKRLNTVVVSTSDYQYL